MDNLVRCLNSECVSISEIANELGLTNDQVELIIDSLLDAGIVSGAYISEHFFASDRVIKKLVTNFVEKTGKIDFHEIVRELSIPENKVKDILEEISRTIIKALAPYRRVRIADLSREIGLPQNFTTFLVKRLISKGKIIGSLDMVDGILLIEPRTSVVEYEKETFKESEFSKIEMERSKNKKMHLEEGEEILQELEKGWYAVRHGERFEWSKSMFRFDLLRKLILTNKRLIFLKKGKIDSEIPIDQIVEVIPDAIGTGNPYIRLKLKNNEVASIFFVCPSVKMFLGALYLLGKQKALVDGWTLAINNLIHRPK